MRIEQNELIAQYFESIKQKYPQLSYDNIKEVVVAPWFYLKFNMESGNLDRIRLKYFGYFYVNAGRARRMIKEAEYRFSKQYITPKQYFKIKASIENYLKRLELETENDGED